MVHSRIASFYFRELGGDLAAFCGDAGSTLRSNFKPGPGSLGGSGFSHIHSRASFGSLSSTWNLRFGPSSAQL